MAKLAIYSSAPLTATADPRVKEGLLLPFGEFGMTNKGKIKASAGSLKTAEKLDPLTLEHVDSLDAAEFVQIEERKEGLWCSIRYMNTPMGDAALAEFESGKRASLSVEVDNPVIRGGFLTAGIVTGGSQVASPAFPSAKLAAADVPVAPDEGEEAKPSKFQTVYKGDNVPTVTLDGKDVEGVTEVAVSDKTIKIETNSESEEPTDEKKDETMAAGNATITNPALLAGKKDETPDKNKLFASIANGFGQGLSGNKLEAALSDVVPANILGIERPQYEGQLWSGQTYERKYMPLFAHGELTSFQIKGWDWKTKPTVDLYTGNKTDIPSAGIETVEANGVLQRIAGGHDIDRKFKDFSNTEFWDAYFAAMSESYARVSDNYVRDSAKAVPTVANGGRIHLLTGNAPAGVPTAIWQIVEGCAQILDNLDTLPTFALVTSDYWKPLLYTKVTDVLAYLNAALGLKEGTLEGQANGFRIVPVKTGSLTVGGWVGKTLVGHREAMKFYELPGNPIRVEAEAISKGGIDEALFGYVGYMVENAKGLVSFDAPAAS